MSDRIDELANEIGAGWQDCPFCGQRPRYRGIRPVISWDVESDGPKCDAPWHTLHPDDALNELATIAREAEAEADKWREAAFCVAYAWWEQDEDSATDYLLYRGWDTTLDGPLSFEALVEDVRQQPHPEAVHDE